MSNALLLAGAAGLFLWSKRGKITPMPTVGITGDFVPTPQPDMELVSIPDRAKTSPPVVIRTPIEIAIDNPFKQKTSVKTQFESFVRARPTSFAWDPTIMTPEQNVILAGQLWS